MAMNHHPKKGQIVLCDFSKGFKEPEMVKPSRPVIVLCNALPGRANLVTVVACSTVRPDNAREYHYQLPKASLPMHGRFQEKETWVKGDMIYTVGLHRLDLIKLNSRHPTTGKRQYFTRCLGREQLRKIHCCVLHGLALGHLSDHL